MKIIHKRETQKKNHKKADKDRKEQEEQKL